jgi:HEPN domain-containing protein
MDASSPLEPSEAAAILARKAGEDATAVREFAANPEIADGIIGFHAQQAIEKWLKAALTSRGVDFEYTHDLRHLIALAGIDEDEAPFDVREAVDLTEYAVPLRYEDLLDAEPLDREATVNLVGKVRNWAGGQLAEATEDRESPDDGESPDEGES